MHEAARGGSAIPFTNTIASVSSAPIASTGLALAIYLYEVHRMTSFQNVAAETFSTSLVGFATLATLLVMALVFERRSTFRLHRHTAACFAIAGVFSLTLLMSFGAAAPVLTGGWQLGASFVMRACETLILLFWGEALLLLTARQAASIVAVAFIVLGCINAVSSLLKESTAGLVIAMLPVLSVVCLYWFKDRATAMNDALGWTADAATVYHVDRSLIPSRHRADLAITGLSFLLPLVCCPVVFGFIHNAWIPAQDSDSTSLFIQLSAAAGTVLGGTLLYMLTASFWGRRKLALYNLFTLLFMTFSFAMVGFSATLAPYLYIVLLNIAQKIAFFFLWIVPFLIPSKRTPLTVWCIGLGLYQVGKIVSSISVASLDGRTYIFLVTVFLFVLIVGNVSGLILDQGKREWFDPHRDTNDSVRAGNTGGVDLTPGSVAAALPSEQSASGIAARDDGATKPDARDLERICSLLAKQYRLSRREEDVLQLLAQGMVARDIAETLVISNSTAKTHMRNLYAKMDVHSQTELILLISQR